MSFPELPNGRKIRIYIQSLTDELVKEAYQKVAN